MHTCHNLCVLIPLNTQVFPYLCVHVPFPFILALTSVSSCSNASAHFARQGCPCSPEAGPSSPAWHPLWPAWILWRGEVLPSACSYFKCLCSNLDQACTKGQSHFPTGLCCIWNAVHREMKSPVKVLQGCHCVETPLAVQTSSCHGQGFCKG